MPTRRKPLFELTAADLMSPDLVTLLEDMPLAEAAERLARAEVHGAPVVDAAGRCAGVLSATDVARWQADAPAPKPVCPTDRDHPSDAGCKRSCGACRKAAAGPVVRQYMTTDPVTVNAGTGIRAIARILTEAQVHRVIVTDAHDRPVGVVSMSDLAVAIMTAPADIQPPVARV